MPRFDSFVMFAGMRTGSNLLEANLNALPGVSCHGELYNPHFIGKKDQEALFDIDLAARDADPARLWARVREETEGLAGFRYFHDHDARMFDVVADDPRCAKIVLTRNPLESYVSWKIARATGQWKLTNVRNLKTAQAHFDGAEFAGFIEDLQQFQIALLNRLQVTGQTAFYIDYDDLQDLAVLNGLAAFLGVEARLDALDDKLKKQNPEDLVEKVENPDEMVAALAAIDRFNLSRTPNFEPRRPAAIPSFVAAGPLMHMPVRSGPEARVTEWLAALGPVERDFNQKTLRQWWRNQPHHRSFAVLRHPLARAHAAFCRLLDTPGPELRNAIRRAQQVEIPKPHKGYADAAEFRAGFLAFLKFLKAHLAGQTGVKLDAHLASQTAILQGFALFQGPDLVLREDRLAEGLAFLTAEAGVAAPPLPAAGVSSAHVTLAEIYGPDLEEAAREAYGRDYQGYGFGDWVPLPAGS